MAYNKGLTQQDKDRINQQIREMAAQGKSDSEIKAWRDAQVEAAKANVPANQTGAPQGPQSSASASGSGSSGSQESETIGQFAQRAGKKKDRVDEDGEVINLAKDFGDLGAFVEGIPFFGDVIDDIYGAVKQGWAQGQTVDDALALFAGGADTDEETINKYIAAVENQRGQSTSKEMEDFNNIYEESGGGAWGFVKAIAQNPTVAATTAISSMVAMLNPASAAGAGVGAAGGAAIAGSATLGIGAGVGAIGGAFAGAGGILETGSSFTEFLQEELNEKGLQFDEAGIAKVLEDEDALARIRGKSAARGGIIAVIDGLTAGVAGKVAGGVTKTAKNAAKIKGVLAATAIEGAGGGVGEAAARLAVGQELDAREIGLEIVGEFGTGVTIGKAAVESQPVYTIGRQKVNRKTVEATLASDPEIAADIQVKNDPELQAQINTSLSDNDKINDNNDVLTTDERDIRDSKVKEIGDNIRERNTFEPKSPEWKALDSIIKEQRKELKETVKEQDFKYKKITPEQKGILASTQSEIDFNNEAISRLQEQQENNFTPTREKLITRLQNVNEEISQQQGEVRAQIEQEAQIRQAKNEQAAATKESKEPKVEEEVTPEQQEAQAEQEAFNANQAQIQEQIQAEVDEEAADNGQKFDKLTDSMLELGIDITPTPGTVPQTKGSDFAPITKEGDALTAGDFEKDINFDPDIPLEKVDAKKAKKEIETTAKQLGATANVELVKVGEGWGIQGKITANKRPESLAAKYATQEEAAPAAEGEQQFTEEEFNERFSDDDALIDRQREIMAEIAEERGYKPFDIPEEYLDNLVDEDPDLYAQIESDAFDRAKDEYVSQAKPKESRTADDYVADIAKKHKSKVDKDSGEFTTPDQRTAYNILGGLKKRGHKDAFIYDSEDGSGYRVNPGKRTVDKDTPQYSVDENRNYNDDQIDDLVFKNAEFVEDNNISQEDYAEVLGPEATEADVAEFSKRMNDQLGREQEGPSQEDIQYELDLLSAPGQTIDQAIEEGITNAQTLYDENDLVFEKANNLYPSDRETGDYDVEGHDNFLNEIQKIIDKKLGKEGPQFSVSEDIHDRMLYDIAEGIGTYGDQNSNAIFDSIWDEYEDDFNGDERAYEEAYNEAYDYATENPRKYIDSLSDYAATVESEPGYKTDEESQERVKRAHDEIDRFASTIEMSVPDDIFNVWSDSFDTVADDINDMSPEELAKYDNLYELISDHDFGKYAWAVITDVMESKGFYGSVDPNVESDKKSEAMHNVYEKVHDYITSKVDDSNPLKAKEEGPQFSVDEASAPENFTQHANLREVSGNRIKMNIGLENNPIDNINGIIKKLQSDKRVRLGTTEQVTGEYEGNPERTVVVDAKFDGTASQFRDYIEKLNADLTQEAIGVQFNGRGSLIYDPKFKGDRYKFDSDYFVQPSGGKKKVFGVDEKDLLVEAGPGQRYEKITLEQASRGSAALAGGKGGFASGGDARESVGQLTEADKKANEAARKAAAALGKVHNLPVGQPLSSEERAKALASVRELARSWKWITAPSGAKSKQSLAPTEGNISYGVGKDGVALTGNTLTQADVDYLNDQYDKLAGYKGAHNHPDRNYRIGVVNDLNKPQRRGGKAPKTPLSGNKPGQITFKGGSRTVDFPITPSKPEKNIILGKDVKEREGTEQFEESFDRRDIGPEERTTLRQNIGKQPKVDEAFVKKYNAGKIGGKQLIKSMTPFILNRQRNQELQGYAVEKFTEQVKAGKLKGKSVKQIFGAARQIADGAATLRNETLGQSRDYQALRNKVRRAEQAFYAENGYEPSNSEIADYLNDNKSKYRVKDDVKVAEVEDAKFDELPEVELGGVQGTTRDRAQTRIAKEAGLDQLTDAVLGPVVSDKVDAAVSRILRGAPVKPSKGRFTDQAPRRGAKFDVKGDKTAAGISKSNTEINKDIQAGIMDFVTASAIRDNFSAIKDIMNIPQESYNDLSKSQKLDLRRKIARGLAAEAEARVGKTGTPSQESSFSVGEGPVHETRASKPYLDNVVSAIKKAWPNTPVKADNASWNKAYASIRNKPRGVLKGMVLGGTIYLNPQAVTMDTPIHEFAHVWASQLRRENTDLWLKGVELLTGRTFDKKTKKWSPRDKSKESEYAKIVQSLSAYKGYPEARLFEEIMANAIGKKGAEMFSSAKEASAWDRIMSSIGKWIKDKLGIDSNKNFDNLTLEDWLQTGVHGVFTGSVPTKPSGKKVEYSVSEDSDADPDMAAARLRNKQSEKKWYNPKSWIGKLIPPAADDYHGLVSRLKIPGIKSVTDAFIKNHQAHIEKVTKAREQISSITKKLGTPLDKVVTKFKGVDLTAAQAIQAHMDGFPNEFSKKPRVQSYIKAMSDLGVLTPSPEKAYDLASPASDIYQYLNTKLYNESFKEFNAKKSQVFSPKVMEKISDDHGAKYAKALTLALQRMSSGKNSGSVMDKTTQKWNDWALGSVGTIMFLNFRSAALQMMSVANFGFDTKSPGKFIANFFDPGTYAEAKKLFNSAYLKERRERAGFDVNAAEMMDQLKNSKTFSEFTKTVLKKGFAATSIVDSMAIAMGGASFIKAQVDSGVSRSEAIKQWKEATEEAQQSARPDRVSQWQTEGVSKFILAFANTPQQYFRLAQKAARTIRSPKASLSDKKKALAKIGYYMVAQNMLFSMAQAASLALIGGGDDEQEVVDGLNSMSSTILRGMGLYGAIIDSGKNVIMEAVKQNKKANPDHVTTMLKATGIAPPLNRKIQDLLAIGRAHNYDADDKEITTIAKGIAVTTNLPTDWAQKKFNASKNLWDDQFSAYQKLLMLMGWSEWNFKDSKGKSQFEDVDFGDVDFGDVDFGEEVEF